MGARDQLCSILLIENLDAVLAKDVASTSRTHTPPFNFFRVGPHQITHGALVRHLLLPINGLDLIQGVDVGGEATVHAEDLLVDDGRQWEEVHNFGAVAPDVYTAILAQTFVVEAVDLRNLPTLMVPSDQSDVLRVAYLQG